MPCIFFTAQALAQVETPKKKVTHIDTPIQAINGVQPISIIVDFVSRGSGMKKNHETMKERHSIT
jgi:hypothetical protein